MLLTFLFLLQYCTKASVCVIGSGFSGLTAALRLSRLGYDVTLFEKLDIPGGRARRIQLANHTWDAGPSWLWFPTELNTLAKDLGLKDFEFIEKSMKSLQTY